MYSIEVPHVHFVTVFVRINHNNWSFELMYAPPPDTPNAILHLALSTEGARRDSPTWIH